MPRIIVHYSAVLFFIVSLATGCRSSQSVSSQSLESPSSSSVSYIETTGVIPSDPAIEEIIIPYRRQLEANIEEVIGEAAGTLELERGSYETTLGNMAADAMLHVINKKVETPVDIAVTNNGGLRVPITAGPITVGRMFELMPFENAMVILDFTGVQIDTLAQQIARSSGAIAGMSFQVDIDSRTASDVRVDGEPVDPATTYRLVTSDYLANGGGRIAILRSPQAREDLPLLLRDAFIEYVREKEIISPYLDGRIRIIGE